MEGVQVLREHSDERTEHRRNCYITLAQLTAEQMTNMMMAITTMTTATTVMTMTTATAVMIIDDWHIWPNSSPSI